MIAIVRRFFADYPSVLPEHVPQPRVSRTPWRGNERRGLPGDVLGFVHGGPPRFEGALPLLEPNRRRWPVITRGRSVQRGAGPLDGALVPHCLVPMP